MQSQVNGDILGVVEHNTQTYLTIVDRIDYSMFGVPRLLPTAGAFGGPVNADIDDDGVISNGLHPNGAVDVNDLLAFLALFEAGDARGDLAGASSPFPDAATDINDLLQFFQIYEIGTRSTTTDRRFGWRGYQWDPYLNLYHVRNRTFDPKMISWLQPDPLGDIDGPNVYAYVRWDPFNRIDPYGLGGDPFEGLGDLGPGQTGRGVEPITRKPGDVQHNIDWTPSELEILHEITGRDNANLKVATVVLQTAGDVVVSLIPGGGETQDVIVLTDGKERWYWRVVAGGSLVLSAATLGVAPNISTFLRGSERVAEVQRAFHATHDSHVQSILKGIEVARTGAGSRFGQGFYLAEELGTAIAETASNGVNRVIKYTVDLKGVKVLDLTDSAIAKKFGYRVGMTREEAQAIGELARKEGYDVIRFKAEKGAGNNLVILKDEAAKKVLAEPVIMREKPRGCE